ncbi:MAG: hypothetical protein K8L97_16245 [Anaerolineae bacterium]|nr:hypothetical protein [Anaerolineae bacterium]
MSDHFLILIPDELSYVPEIHAQDKMLQLLRSFGFDDDMIQMTTSESVQFIDQGANFEHILCPLCKNELQLEQWQLLMDAAYRTGFAQLEVVVPCCSQSTSLNDLIYQWPAGFARFRIEIFNPSSDINETQMHVLETALGYKARKIWRHI